MAGSPAECEMPDCSAPTLVGVGRRPVMWVCLRHYEAYMADLGALARSILLGTKEVT